MNAIRQSTCSALLLALICAASICAWPQTSVSTAVIKAHRFVAVHGYRSAIFGYAARDLEIWGYPFQIIDSYTVDFQAAGSPVVLNGASLLSRIEVSPDQIVRIWSGSGFQVKETDFVPHDNASAILQYDVSGSTKVDLVIHCRPVMDLMWPASAGGQEVRWDDTVHGYILSESTNHYGAVLASNQIVQHQAIINSTEREDLTQVFTLRPERHDGFARAKLYVVLLRPGEDAKTELRSLVENEPRLRQQSQDQLLAWKAQSLSILTPDAEINAALDWADTALYQSWACDEGIGCGATAGFGPSRPMRRPQYDWFFAGDGMVAAEAMLASGHAEKAREELEFILRRQNPSNGMIWHEMSQSAGFLDWTGKYPYMYPHVDLSFQFLSTVADYYAHSGDLPFINSHWSALDAAFRFCKSLINPDTGLPTIPSAKMGANEQDQMREDAGLSAAWVGAAAAYAQLAQASGHDGEAKEAQVMSQRTRAAYGNRYWNQAEQFWISGYTVGGAAMNVRRSGPAAALSEHLFSSVQENNLFNSLAGASFQADWGTRSLASDSSQYDPGSYSKGSVSALHTGDTALAFWDAHRPVSAWQIWSGLVSWNRLDSLGHIEEVLRGNVFAPQVESVPEQTWSSASFLNAAVKGLMGVDIDGAAQHLTLAPHHFPDGGAVKIANLHAAGAIVSMTVDADENGTNVVLKNEGAPIHLTLTPEIPLGSSQVHAFIEGKSAPVEILSWDQEQQAKLDFRLEHGETRCRIEYSGGVWIEIPRADIEPDAKSKLPHVRDVRLNGDALEIDADALSGTESSLVLQTHWPIASVDGGKARQLSSSRTGISFSPTPASGGIARYVGIQIRIRFRNLR